jgi:integrase
VLRAALRLAWKDGKIPLIALPPKGQPRQRVLSSREVRRLRAAVRHCWPLHLFLELGLAHGARRGAILELTWDRVDLDAKIVDYRAPHPRAARRKNRAVVPLVGASLIRLLRDGHRRATTERVIELSASRLERGFRAATRMAGLIGVTPHVLRHTVVTEVTRRQSLERASKLVGHKSIALTQEVYEHLKVGDLRPAARAMANWLRA